MEHLSQESWDLAQATAEVLARELAGMDLVFTHDWCFTGWNLPHFLGLLGAAARLPGTRFYHWVHSIPTLKPEGRDWWRVRDWGGRHKVVFPNRTDAVHVARQYRGDPGGRGGDSPYQGPAVVLGFRRRDLPVHRGAPGNHERGRGAASTGQRGPAVVQTGGLWSSAYSGR